ncbi:UNVERIFIED_CONTAM: type III restriction enzyme [Acetivibrio alkalicellulosi]
MSKVKFHFQSDQKHQIESINAVKDLFLGQPKNMGSSSLEFGGYQFGLKETEYGFANKISLVETEIVNNLKEVQSRHLGFCTGKFEGMHFTVEMETGTGKTYAYLRSIIELYLNYGFCKYIIVVPTIPIRKGIEKSIQMLSGHFATLYNGIDISQHSFVYDSKKITRLEEFITSNKLQIAIMNIQSFNSGKTKIQQEDERGKIYWKLLSKMNPIVIIDEPQRIEGNEKKISSSMKALLELNPALCLRYSATHKKLYNPIYKLDSFDAYEQGLVKKIEVCTVYSEVENCKDFPYVRYIKFNSDFTAKIEILRNTDSGVKVTDVDVKKGSSLFELSGGLKQYKDSYVVKEPHKKDGLEICGLEISGIGVFFPGEDNFNKLELDYIRTQIKITIKKHLEKQYDLLKAGYNVKVLSLFFIDEVKKYRDYERADTKGEYARIFEEEYKNIISPGNLELNELLNMMPSLKDEGKIHEGYFAVDKNKNIVEVNTSKWNYNNDDSQIRKTPEEVERGIQLILDKKDELVSLNEPLSFIFAHSALREGWDNPNVFQICMLRNTKSEIYKKQEIGRGLRLAVDTNGERRKEPEINVLTVIANEHYDTFAQSLQNEYNEDASFDKEVFSTDDALKIKNIIEKFTNEEVSPYFVEKLIKELVDNKIIDKNKNKLITNNIAELDKVVFTDPTLSKYGELIKEKIVERMKEKESKRIEFINGDKTKKNEFSKFISDSYFSKLFEELRERLQKRTLYKVNIDEERFIKDCAIEINSRIARGSEYIVAKEAKMKMDRKKGAKLENETISRYEVDERIEITKSAIEIINYIMQHTRLPRQSIIKILSLMKDSDLLQRQTYLDEVLKIIKRQLSVHEAKRIEYSIINDYIFEYKELFDLGTIDTTKIGSRVFEAKEKSKKSLYRYVSVGSDGEYEFAKELDNDENVLLFTKIKKGKFVIDTPLGGYSPDWAIIYKVSEEKAKIFFIIETKCDKEKKDMTEVEEIKINCAKKHFAAVNTKNDIICDWARDYDHFKATVKNANNNTHI